MASNYTIVTVNVSRTVAAIPSNLQQTGALVSQGGTTLSQNTLQYLTQLSDLTPLLSASLTLSSLAWAGGTVTATTAAPHGVTNGQTFLTTIAGATPAGYNGTYLATATGTSTFTYALTVNPGTESAPGTYTRPGQAELVAMATAFFAQGNTTGVNVLELGTAAFPIAGIGDLGTWITNNPLTVCAFLVPTEWDGQSTFLALVEEYEALSAMTYFFVTTTSTNLSDYTAQMKDVFALVPAPNTFATSFDTAAPFYSFLNNQPSAVSQVPPMSYRFMSDVTPWLLTPGTTNPATVNAILGAKGNVILTGAEGGITNSTLYKGTMMDGNDASYWYSVDWIQIQTKLALANAVINGSNNPQNPLYYNQAGINQLRAVAQNVINSGIAFGLVLGPATVTATPFYTYTQQNPFDYEAGKYNGLAVTATPQLGFKSITFNLQVDQFVQQPASQGG